MRLLQLRDGELTLTPELTKNEDIPRYAILSHTWGPDGEEVTIEDVRTGRGKDKAGYKKILFCGQEAQRDDLEHFWVDTCCIDKSNSTEYAEAITSMFKWYQRAEQCYVFLSDVSVGSRWESQFRSSRWFTRGWTLQELLAPSSVKFYSAEEKLLGNKTGMVDRIHRITKIPVSALQGTSLAQFSTEEKFEWSRRRETKREEDIVYCLFGILGVYLSVLYGEGKEYAMSRLKGEIDRRCIGSPQISQTAQASRLVIPFGQNVNFVGREGTLTRIVEKILPSARETDCQRTLLGGVRGIGKTQIAAEAAYRVHARDPKCWVFWVSATTMKGFEDGYKKIGEALGTPGLDNGKRDIKALVKLSLEKCTADWLLIIDGVDNANLFGSKGPSTRGLQDYLPFSRKGSILMTSRSRQIAVTLGLSLMQIHEVKGMRESDALKLLSSTLERWQYEGRQATKDLVRHLNYQPFAVQQSSKIMAYMRETTAAYLEYCLECQPVSNEQYPWTLDSTKCLADLLLLKGRKNGAVFIYRQLFERVRSKYGPHEPFVLDSMDDLAWALECQRNYKEAEELHRQALKLEIETNGQKSERALKSMNNLAVSLQGQGKFGEAERLHRQELSLSKKDRDDPDTLMSLHNLAFVLSKQKKYADAERFVRRVLKLRRSRLGPTNESTQNSMELLEKVLCRREKTERLERLHRKVLRDYALAVGPMHPLIWERSAKLVDVLRLQGKNEEAQEVHRLTSIGESLSVGLATGRTQPATKSRPRTNKGKTANTKPDPTKPNRTKPSRIKPTSVPEGDGLPWWKLGSKIFSM